MSIRHLICPIFSSLEVMPRVSTALHLPVAHDDITGQLANDNNNCKFSTCPYIVSQETAIEIEVMVTSHPEIVKEIHVRHTDSSKFLKGFALITDELNIP